VLASVVIPAYNAAPHFEECLGSILAQTCGDFEVIWVDNASIDDSLRRVRERFPTVKALALGENAGYRRGSNAGAEQARGKYLVICNQDVRVEPTWLEEMIAAAEAQPDVGLVAPKIMLHDRPEALNEAGNTLQYCGLFTSRGLGEPAERFNRPETLATISGCAFLARRDLWVRLGGFSADFDAYETGFHAGFEDVDLAWRAQLAGFRVVFCPTAVMYHKFERKDTNLRLFHAYQWNRYMIVLRNYRLRSLLALAPLLACLEAAACTLAACRGWKALANNLRVLRWFFANRRLLKRMRDLIQSTRVVNDGEIVARMEASVSFARAIGVSLPMRVLQSVASGMLTAYYRPVLWMLRFLEPSDATVADKKSAAKSRRSDPPHGHAAIANGQSFQRAVKRAIDVAAAAAILIAAAPLMGCIALLVLWRMGRPVLFCQRRPGLHGRPFVLVKFRTMDDARRPDGSLRGSAERTTPLGRFLRRASLDELPQLWNVLRGDLSLVGPRPLLMEYVDRYNAEQARRLDAKPGITGWAQISGRNAISWEKKFELDAWYVDHWNLTLDLRILLTTAWKVLRCEGINAGADVGMPAFLGSAESKNNIPAKPVRRRLDKAA